MKPHKQWGTKAPGDSLPVSSSYGQDPTRAWKEMLGAALQAPPESESQTCPTGLSRRCWHDLHSSRRMSSLGTESSMQVPSAFSVTAVIPATF